MFSGIAPHYDLMNRIMTGEFVSGLREEIKSRLKQWPGIGDRVYKAARQLEETIKGLVVPGILFEEMGFTYVGPVDGHNLSHLIETLKNVKRLKGPRLVHVITKKGKGYTPAEADPARFHGVSKFDIATGASVQNGRPTFTDAFGDAVIQLAELDNKVIAVTAAMGLGTGLEKFSQLFPDRFYDIGIESIFHAQFFGQLVARRGAWLMAPARRFNGRLRVHLAIEQIMDHLKIGLWLVIGPGAAPGSKKVVATQYHVSV